MSALGLLKKHYKSLLYVGIFLVSLPLITVLVQILFTYGNYVGTFVRSIADSGVCL